MADVNACHRLQSIWKFKLTPGQPVMMPAGKVLSAHAQGDDICVWAQVQPGTPLRPVRFSVHPTGSAFLETSGRFLGTVLLAGGSLVFHVFEETSHD